MMQYSVRVFLLISFIFTVHGDDQYKIVETTNGHVRGVRNVTLLTATPFYSFKGIPYAQPPIDDLRFKAPVPVEPWKSSVLDAFDYSNICVQPGKVMPNPLPQSEDCLTLNIFVPANVDEDAKMAVLFFIHGGGFIEGAGDDFFYGPDFIIEKNTILVTINYRLGIFGFLSLNSVEYSGNMGLKDQQLALKWIHANIGQFGGDDKRITIFGHSAGGASTNYHILSSESRKYFQNAIPMSGSVSNYWALSPEKDHLKMLYQIANDLGSPQNTFDDLVSFLKATSADELNEFSLIQSLQFALYFVVFGPIVERKDANQPFLSDIPENVYESSEINVNAMFTIASNEAVSVVPKPPEFFLRAIDDNFNVPLPFRKYNLSLESDEHRALAKEIRAFYFGDSAIDETTIPTFVNLLGDLNFVLGIDQNVNKLAEHSTGNTFYSWFSVDSKLNVWKNQETFKRGGDILILPGAGHGDDLCYIFRCGMAEQIYDDIMRNDDEDSKITRNAIENISKMFTNFAKYGKPTHENDSDEVLLPIQKDQTNCIIFTNDGLTSSPNPRQEAIEFWSGIEQKSTKLSAKSKKKERDEL